MEAGGGTARPLTGTAPANGRRVAVNWPDMKLFTSESVTEGHPDKVADRISDAVLDAMLRADEGARVACETLVSNCKVILAGEVSDLSFDFEATARKAIRDIGYDDPQIGFAADEVEVEVLLNRQSPDIAGGVNKSLEARQGSDDPDDREGAGDQGLMFGYANRESEHLMPLPIALAHQMASRLAQVRKDGDLSYLYPDGKTQVTVEYENGCPVAVPRVLISAHHAPGIPNEQMKEDLRTHVLEHCGEGRFNERTELLVNPSGKFEKGGPAADAGLTGRKIIVDTYGGYARHGGGAFSGKDPSKVDRSAAYFARYVAKNVVASKLADACEIAVSYAIGKAKPFSLNVETFGTERMDPARLKKLVKEFFDFRPKAMLDHLGLRRPIYTPTSSYGHFGRPESPPEFPWENTDRAAALAKEAG